MKNKFFFYLLLGTLAISCIGKQNFSTQLKNGLKKNPVKFLNYIAFESSRNVLLDKIDEISLTSDTLIVIEGLTDEVVSYRVFLYNSNTKDAKAYKMDFDLQNYPSGKLNEISLLDTPMEILHALQQGNINEKIEEVRKTLIRIPPTLYLITVGIKKNNKFEFEYYRIYPFNSSFPSGRWVP